MVSPKPVLIEENGSRNAFRAHFRSEIEVDDADPSDDAVSFWAFHGLYGEAASLVSVADGATGSSRGSDTGGFTDRAGRPPSSIAGEDSDMRALAVGGRVTRPGCGSEASGFEIGGLFGSNPGGSDRDADALMPDTGGLRGSYTGGSETRATPGSNPVGLVVVTTGLLAVAYADATVFVVLP